ncbi:hypothetical protein, partial [Salinactinospora qingdaonensis]|uniref:hypothetical protein n=1 Tax=Salinactinospora qingdaonensis TaxID=702744 RepID=UPI0031ED831D
QQPPRKNAAAKGQKTRHKKNKHALLSSQETTAQPPQAKNQLFREDGVPKFVNSRLPRFLSPTKSAFVNSLGG